MEGSSSGLGVEVGSGCAESLGRLRPTNPKHGSLLIRPMELMLRCNIIQESRLRIGHQSQSGGMEAASPAQTPLRLRGE